MKTTLKQILETKPSSEILFKLVQNLGPDLTQTFSILQILDQCGIECAAWCLRAVKGHDQIIIDYAEWCKTNNHDILKDPENIKKIDEIFNVSSSLSNFQKSNVFHHIMRQAQSKQEEELRRICKACEISSSINCA